MSVRVVIVDDEKPARDRLLRLLGAHPDFLVVGEAADAPSAAALIDRERPDLCFLDVKMPEGDGFDVLRRVRHRPRVIVTTAYDQYAVRAFEVNSLDYLLKPFDAKRLAAALDRASEALRQEPTAGDDPVLKLLEEIRAGLPRADVPTDSDTAPAGRAGAVLPTRIPARRGPKILLLDPGDVLWFEAEEALVFARTSEGRLLVERTLGELEILLTQDFFRAHRSYLVNLARVGEILPGDAGTYRIVMRDEARTVLPLSRRQAQRLRELIPW